MDKNENPNSHYYKSLKRKMIVLIIAVSITPMFIISGVILHQFHQSYQNKIHAHLKELVQKHKQNIDNFLYEKLGDIRLQASSYTFAKLSDEVFLESRLMLLRQKYEAVFTDMGVVNDQGMQIAYAGPFKLINADYSGADWFRRAIKRPYFISDVFLGLRSLPHFIISVRQKWQGKYFLLRVTIDFGAFNSLVENLRVGRTGFAFILNREGEYQTQPPKRIMAAKAYFNFLLSRRENPGDRIDIVKWRGPAGIMQIYVAAFLKGGDWLMVIQQEYQDAFRDLDRTKNIAWLILFAGGLLIVTMALISSDRMVQRMAQADREKEMLNQQVIETGKLASIGELAAGIAHEINNPVAIMVEEAGWIEDLLAEEDFQGGENLAEFSRALAQIKTQGRRCKSITHKLLSFARKTDPRTHDIQINALITDMVELSAQKARYSNVDIKTDLQPDLPPVKLSEPEMQQVLLNLINNALDALEKQGGAVTLGSRADDSGITVQISDDGPGIPKANLARIFDPFFTTKPVGKGTGLGLSICYGIIKKTGGTLDVRSVVDMGTTFTIHIPNAPAGQGNDSNSNSGA